MMKRLQQYRKWLYIFSASTIVIVLGVYLLIFQPLFDEIVTAELELEEIIEDRQSLLSELENDMNETVPTEDITQLMRGLPVSPSVENIIRDFARIERETQVSVTSLSFDVHSLDQPSSLEEVMPTGLETSIDDRYLENDQLTLSTITFTLEIEGDYDRFMTFLQRSIELPRIMRVNQLTMMNQDRLNGEQDSQLSSTISFTAYYIEQFAPFVNRE